MGIPIIGRNTEVSYSDSRATVAVNSADRQMEAIISSVSGKRWSVDYYQQVIGDDDEIQPFDILSSFSTTQYREIRNLDIIVQSEFSSGVGDVSDLEGDAVLDSDIVANPGDLIVATLMNGRKVLMDVREVTSKSYELRPVFYITYKIQVFLDSNPSYLDSLKSRLIDKLVFDKDSLRYGSEKLITDEKFKIIENLNKDLQLITDHYFRNTYDSKLRLLTVPGLSARVVDFGLQEFIFKLVSVRDHNIPDVNRYADIPLDNKRSTLWEVIMDRNLYGLFNTIKSIKLIDINTTYIDPKLRSIGYSGVDYFLASTENTTIKHVKASDKLTTSELEYETIPLPDIGEEIKLFDDAFYILDNTSTTKSILEIAVWEYLTTSKIDLDKLVALNKEYIFWEGVELYYYTPILILLNRDALIRRDDYGSRLV